MVSILVILSIQVASFTNPVDEEPSTPGTISGQVTEYYHNKSVQNASIRLFEYDTGNLIATTITNNTGFYAFTNVESGTYIIRVSAVGYSSESTTVVLLGNQNLVKSFVLKKYSASDKGAASSSMIPVTILALFSLIIIVIIASLFYSKLAHSNILTHETRKLVYDYIINNPGKHYRAILVDLNLKMGVLTHHLNTLERESYIKSVPDGMYRRYYQTGTQVDFSYQLNGIQKSVFFVIKENPGISQSDFGAILGVNRMLVNYHVKKLREKGLIRVEYESGGKTSFCYAVQIDT
jgi:predicted transcriptional regulator